MIYFKGSEYEVVGIARNSETEEPMVVYRALYGEGGWHNMGADEAGSGEDKTMSECRNWSNGDPILEEYHDHEWCKVNHDDNFQFEMLCLEGASVGLSWKTIMHKREAYKEAFHGFDIDACAAMTDEELEAQLSNTGLIRNRNKIFSVRKNAQVVQKIQKEFGSLDAYLWNFTDGSRIDGHWKTPAEIPTVSDVSRRMSADMKKRGIGFVGPVITYSFLQAVGIVNDHLEDCEYR